MDEPLVGRDNARAEMVAATVEARPVSESERSAEARLVELMEKHERPIYAFLVALLHDSDLALDCAQDTFFRAYHNLQKGKPVNNQWLYKVARNRAMDEFRRAKRVQPDLETLEQVPVHEHTDRTLAIQAVLAHLSPNDREVLYLYDIAGFTSDEIAGMLGIRHAAVRQRLSRARERFRQLYGAER